MRMIWLAMAVFAASVLSGCGGDDLIDYTCDEVQLYQTVRPTKRVEAPEGLDQLNELAEMQIPKPENAPERPPGSRCIILPPNVGSEN